MIDSEQYAPDGYHFGYWHARRNSERCVARTRRLSFRRECCAGRCPGRLISQLGEFSRSAGLLPHVMWQKTVCAFAGRLFRWGETCCSKRQIPLSSGEICEDFGTHTAQFHAGTASRRKSCSTFLADNEGIGKHTICACLISQQSARCTAGYVFSSCGFGESMDVVAGNGPIYENDLRRQTNAFSSKAGGHQ